MARIKCRLPEIAVHDYNRIYESVYEIMVVRLPLSMQKAEMPNDQALRPAR